MHLLATPKPLLLRSFGLGVCFFEPSCFGVTWYVILDFATKNIIINPAGHFISFHNTTLNVLHLPNSLHWRPRDSVFSPFSCLSILIPCDVISSCDSNYHLYVVKSKIRCLGPDLSPKPLSHTTNCSNDFSTWISNTKLKFNMFKQELLTYPTQILCHILLVNRR